jgi:molybdenum cofactor sulfurtransferase
MSILDEAHSAGFATVVDAAALASSTRVSLQQIPAADAMVVSFYKMFGYPTGVGGLIAKKSFLATLGKKRFGGGATDFAHAPDLNARLEVSCLNSCLLSRTNPT